MSEKLNIHILPPLLVCICAFFVVLFVLLRNPRSSVNRSFFVLGLSVSLWQFSRTILYLSSEPSGALIWARIDHYSASFISSATYHFVVSFLKLRKRWLVGLFYTLSFTTFFVMHICIPDVQKLPWGYYPVFAPVHMLYMLVWIIPFILSLRYLHQRYNETKSPPDRQRIQYLFVTLPIAYLGVIDLLPAHGVKLYPLGFIPVMFFIISTSYATARYRLLDVEIIVKKMTLTSLAFVGSFGIIYLGTFYLHPYLSSLWGKNWIVIPVLVSCLVSLGLFKFINFVRHIQEDELSKRFAYRPLLKREAERISQVRNLEELLTYITRDLSAWMRLDYVGIFRWDGRCKTYVLAKSLTRSSKRQKIPSGILLPESNPLVVQLLKTRRPLVSSEIDYNLHAKETPQEQRGILRKVITEMKQLGAEITIPCFCEERLLGIINIGNKLNPKEIVTHEDVDILFSLASTIARAAYGFILKEEKIQLIVASQNILITAIEAKDFYTRGHTDRVAQYSTLIGNKLEKQLRGFLNGPANLGWAAQLHDVGKISIPDSILLKPGPLDDEEWTTIKEHPANGLKIIDPVREWLGEDICSGILYHHENYDGSGYPHGKKEKEIHFFARIIRVADTFDAMSTDRPYRPAFPKEEVIKELKKYRGIYFDPHVVDVTEALYNKGKL